MSINKAYKWIERAKRKGTLLRVYVSGPTHRRLICAGWRVHHLDGYIAAMEYPADSTTKVKSHNQSEN